MLTDKKIKKYIQSKQFQKDCDRFNKRFVALLNNHSDDMSDSRFVKFAECVLPSILIGHVSNYFEHHYDHDENSVDTFISTIKSTIMEDCDIEKINSEYTMIDDIGAVA
tara:strand:- start:2257 stop:2583 length:327 start_codon:yes stop_codon:yes gene_type:complete